MSASANAVEAPQPLAFWAPSAQWGHVGLDPGFVDKDQGAGIEVGLMNASAGVYARRWKKLARARVALFKPQPFTPQKQPNCIVRDLDPARGKLVPRLTDPYHDGGAMRLKYGFVMAAHLAGRYRASRSIMLRPLGS